MIMLYDYQPLFELNKLPYLISDTLSKNYDKLEAVFTFDGEVWKSYLPKAVAERTLEEGRALFGSEAEFAAYKAGFEAYKNESSSFFEEISALESISPEQLSAFIDYITRLHAYYVKTEFFYTDKAFADQDSDPVVRENLQHLDHIKNSGRAHLNSIFFGADGYLSRTLAKLSAQSGISQDRLIHHSQREILGLLEGKQVPAETIEDRLKAYVFLHHGKKQTVLSGQEALELIKEMNKIEEAEETAKGKDAAKTLKGIVASKGKAEGIARVINVGFDNFDKASQFIDEMRAGEILVAQTTSPEIIRACRKAAAIITNQGGLMSHAAIVSRELQIPCIVGVGDATSRIKSGDRLAVDADTGVIEILETK